MRPLENQLPSRLSGGEAQRAALAKALVARPKVLLLDEPLSQLDGLNKEMLRASILHLAKQYSQTTMMVTHDPTDAMRLADRIAIVANGRIDALGTPTELYDRPTSTLSGNLLSPWGRMTWLDSAMLPEHLKALIPPENNGFVGFRPEKFQLELSATATRETAQRWDIHAKVQSVQNLGFAKLVVADFANPPLLAIVPNDCELAKGMLSGYIAADDLRFVQN